MKFEDISAGELEIADARLVGVKRMDAVVRLSRRSDGILAKYEVSFTAEFNCVSCLAMIRKDFCEKFQLEFVPGEDPFSGVGKVELKAGEIDRIFFKGVYVDTRIGIREAVVLALPAAPRCADDCPGLCPVCGKKLKKSKACCTARREGRFSAIKGKKR